MNISKLCNEEIAFAGVYDMAYVIMYDSLLISTLYISLSMTTDSSFLFGILIKASFKTQKNPEIDLKSVQNPYEKGEIKGSAYIWSGYNIPDSSTKLNKQIILVKTNEQAMFDHSLQQWSILPEKSDSTIQRENVTVMLDILVALST